MFSSKREAMVFVRDNCRILDIVLTNPYSMVKIECTVAGQQRYAVGFSKCGPRDTYNKELGGNIALGRAIRDIALTLVTRPTCAAVMVEAVSEPQLCQQ